MKKYLLIIHLLLLSTKAFSQETVFPQQMTETKGKWKPTLENGTPANSEFVMEVNFNHNTYDHD